MIVAGHALAGALCSLELVLEALAILAQTLERSGSSKFSDLRKCAHCGPVGLLPVRHHRIACQPRLLRTRKWHIATGHRHLHVTLTHCLHVDSNN
jgi:hypothetical protein